MVAIATRQKVPSSLPSLFQERLGHPKAELAGLWMAIVPGPRIFVVRGNLALMCAEQDFGRYGIRPVVNKPLKEFAHRRGRDVRRKCHDGRLRIRQCWCIALIGESPPLSRGQHFRRGAPQIHSVAAD